MKKRIETQVDIDAPAQTVWQVLIDTPSYPAWNPFIESLSGELLVNKPFDLYCTFAKSGREYHLKPTVTRYHAPRELMWQSKWGMRGIVDYCHYFRIEPLSDTRVEFIHGGDFGGLLAPLLIRFAQSSLHDGFMQMNEALKARAEKIYHAQNESLNAP